MKDGHSFSLILTNHSFTNKNQCLTPNIIYRADIHCQANKDHKFYFGVAQTPFKERFRNHKQYIKSTEIPKYIWSLKDAETPYTINWSIVAKVKGNTKINYCPLRLTEYYPYRIF